MTATVKKNMLKIESCDIVSSERPLKRIKYYAHNAIMYIYGGRNYKYIYQISFLVMHTEKRDLFAFLGL